MEGPLILRKLRAEVGRNYHLFNRRRIFMNKYCVARNSFILIVLTSLPLFAYAANVSNSSEWSRAGVSAQPSAAGIEVIAGGANSRLSTSSAIFFYSADNCATGIGSTTINGNMTFTVRSNPYTFSAVGAYTLADAHATGGAAAVKSISVNPLNGGSILNGAGPCSNVSCASNECITSSAADQRTLANP